MTVNPAVTETIYPLLAANLGPFATVFPYEVASDVVVTLDAGGGLVTLGNGPGYGLVGATPLLTGGQVTLQPATLTGAAWPTGAKLIIDRRTWPGQSTPLGELIGFSPSIWEAALDHIARQVEDVSQLAQDLIYGLPTRIVTLTANAVAAPADVVLSMQVPLAPVVVSIPPASGATGRRLMIRDGLGTAELYPIAVTPSAGRINGAASVSIATNWGGLDIVCDGGQWLAK